MARIHWIDWQKPGTLLDPVAVEDSAVPRPGDEVQLSGGRYKVVRVVWVVDETSVNARGRATDRALRAMVELDRWV